MTDDDRTTDDRTRTDSTDARRRRRPVTPPYQAPAGATATSTWAPDGQESLSVTATAGWTVLRREESPAAEVFSVAWVVDDAPADRPVTFVFNGGPGASAAYLHVGAIGPRRVDLPADGSLPRMPVRLVDNDASWLPQTDLVFVDPVGTGFSRRIPASDDKDDKDDKDDTTSTTTSDGDRGYYEFAADLAAMREFIGRWLSANGRWSAPVVIAGESYGGYRVGRLARSLQEDEGVGLAGAILISPALELGPLTATDYSMESFIDTLPSMAAGALHHGRCRAAGEGASVDEVVVAAAQFATGDYATFLARGAAMDADARDDVLGRLADLVGLDRDVVDRVDGRVTIVTWVRELLRDERKVVGLYDATQVTTDPFPDREPFAGADPTLAGITPAFTMGVNQVLRGEIGLESERRYELLSLDVNEAWKVDEDVHALEMPPGATDDLRYGLSLNPHLRVLIVHGRHDLVTPSHTSVRLRDLMRLDPATGERVDLRTYDGGHMFYALADSRAAFAADARDFLATCLGDPD